MIIHIHSHRFEISEPYSAGQTLGEAEAQALNALRAQGVRNNCYRVVPNKILLGEELRAARAAVEEYDRGYAIALRNGPATRRVTFEDELDALRALEPGRDPDDPALAAEAVRRLQIKQSVTIEDFM